MRILIAWLLLCVSAQAATYYVRKDGNNGNAGTADNAGGAWLTVTYAESQMSAGDTVYVRAGTYEEKPTVNISGNSGAWINFVGGTNVIIRGVIFSAASYVRWIGFEITHTTTAYGQRPIQLLSASSYIQILDNYIHDVYSGTTEAVIYGAWDSQVHHITIRGNVIYYVNNVAEVSSAANYGIASPNLASFWLVEYNTLGRIGDYVNLYGTNHICRNNVLTDHQDSYWTQDSTEHSDIFQPGSDGQQDYCRYHVYERNFSGDNLCHGGSQNAPNGHFALFQDITGYGDTNIIVRGNSMFNFSDGAIGIIGADKISTYNNSIYGFSNAATYAQFIVFRSTANPTLNGLAANTIFSILDGSTEADKALLVEANCTATRTHNLGYLTGTDASFVSTSDPLFVSPNTPDRNFRLQAGSPAINAGTNVVWVTSASSSGTSFDINDGQLLCDGWGMVEGDIITTGGTTTRITGISGSTVTVAASVTWTNLQPVYWGTDTTPDIGALPYGSTALTAATISANGTTYTVTPTGDARGVWFYTNGIPSHFDYDAPYSATLDGAVTAKVYALYAQSSPVIAATEGEPEPPAPTGSTATVGTFYQR